MVDSLCADTALAMLTVAATELIEDVHSELLDAADIRPAAWRVRAESLAALGADLSVLAAAADVLLRRQRAD